MMCHAAGMNNFPENTSESGKGNGDKISSVYNEKNKVLADDMEEGNVERKHQMPPASVMTRLILIMVWRKLIRNPNTYSSLLGLTWSLISYRYLPITYLLEYIIYFKALIISLCFKLS